VARRPALAVDDCRRRALRGLPDMPAPIEIDNGNNAVEVSAKGIHFSIVMLELCSIVSIHHCVCVVMGPGK
jgi:hypothetical protein